MSKRVLAGLVVALVLALASYAAADFIYDGADGSLFAGEDESGRTPAAYSDGPDEDLTDMELSPIPEPGTWLLIGTGMLLLFGYLRRRRIKN